MEDVCPHDGMPREFGEDEVADDSAYDWWGLTILDWRWAYCAVEDVV